MLRLDFSLADLSLPPQREKTRRASISGVQDKVQLSRRRGRLNLKPCDWGRVSEITRRYHDEEWGMPVRDDRRQVEYLMMEVMHRYTKCGNGAEVRSSASHHERSTPSGTPPSATKRRVRILS